MSIKKTILISFLVLIIILGGVIFAIKTSYKKQQKEIPERGKIIYFKVFKNGIDPKTSLEEYQKIFQEIQGLVNLPVKYPTNLPEGYKLFKISVWQEEMGVEGVNVYFGKKNTNTILEKHLNFIKTNNPKTTFSSPLEKDNETVLLKETFMSSSLKNLSPKNQLEEKKLKNGRRGLLVNKKEIDPWDSLPFKKILYIGYARKNEKTYYYLINSNIATKEILSIANSIIENEKNE